MEPLDAWPADACAPHRIEHSLTALEAEADPGLHLSYDHEKQTVLAETRPAPSACDY
ncbi:hypothetical protein GCM10027168_56300 [Streptomyces capparidis]